MKRHLLGLALLTLFSSTAYSQDAADLLKNSTKYIDQPHLIVGLEKDNSSEIIDIIFGEGGSKASVLNFTGKIKNLSETRKQQLNGRFETFTIKEVEVEHKSSTEWHLLLLKDGDKIPLTKEQKVEILGVMKYPNEKGFMLLKAGIGNTK